MESTCTRVTPQAWHYLWSNGYKHSRDPATGYSALNFLAQQQQHDRSARQVTEELRSVIHDPMTRPPKRETHEMWRPVKQLQNTRKLQQPRNKFGVVIADPDAIGSEIANFWAQTMPVKGPPLDHCSSYL